MASEIQSAQNSHMFESPAYDSRFDIFSLPKVDTATASEKVIEFHPTTAIRDGAPIDITILGMHDLYLDFSRSTLRLSFEIVRRDGTVVDESDKVSVANLALASLIRQCDIYVGYQIMSSDVSQNYYYKSLIDSLVRNSASYLKSFGPSMLFFKDSAGQIDNISLSEDGLNLGQVERFKVTSQGLVTLEGPLFADLWEMQQYLPSGVRVDLKLHPQNARFSLMTNSLAQNYDIKIRDCSFLGQFVQPTDAVAVQHLKMLQKRTALFSLPRSVVKSFPIPGKLREWSIDNVYSSQIPYEIYICFVQSDAYHGDVTLSPANLRHYDLESITFSLETQEQISYNPNFAERKYNREYLDLVRNNINTTSIDYTDYDGGYTIFRLQVKPDVRRAFNLSTIKSQTRLKVRFRNELPHNVTAIIYGRYHTTFSLDASRNVYLNMF